MSAPATRRRAVVAGGLLAGLATSLVAWSLWRGGEPRRPLGAELGVQVVSLRTTAAGHLLDLRFRVTDPDRAAALLQRSVPVELRLPATGLALPVVQTRLGAMRQTTPKPEPGRMYFALFPSSGLVPGQRLSLHAGAAVIRDIPVE